jgi:hypothetical protein
MAPSIYRGCTEDIDEFDNFWAKTSIDIVGYAQSSQKPESSRVRFAGPSRLVLLFALSSVTSNYFFDVQVIWKKSIDGRSYFGCYLQPPVSLETPGSQLS